MSPANIYRFFASKTAINEAICEKHFAAVHGDHADELELLCMLLDIPVVADR
jgi:AcrR family transcriptional regulator